MHVVRSRRDIDYSSGCCKRGESLEPWRTSVFLTVLSVRSGAFALLCDIRPEINVKNSEHRIRNLRHADARSHGFASSWYLVRRSKRMLNGSAATNRRLAFAASKNETNPVACRWVTPDATLWEMRRRRDLARRSAIHMHHHIYSQPARSPPGTSTHSHHGSRLWLAIEQVLMLRPETSKGRSRGERRLAVMLSDYCKDDGPAAPIDVSRSRHYKYSARPDSAHGSTRKRRRTGGPNLWAAMLEKGSTPQAPSSCVRSMSLILCLT